MSKEILKTNNTGLFGKKLNLPYAGETKISEDGEIEVETKVAELLINKYDGTFFREKDIEVVDAKEVKAKAKGAKATKPAVEPEAGSKGEEGKEDEGKEEEDEDANLEELSLEELIELAKEAGFKEPTYRKFKGNKKLMIKFLNDKA